MGWRQIEGMGEILTDRHSNQKQSQSCKTSSALKIRLSSRQAPWYRQINSLQGHQKRRSVIMFLLRSSLTWIYLQTFRWGHFADNSTHFHSPLGICQALPSTCALSHVIPIFFLRLRITRGHRHSCLMRQYLDGFDKRDILGLSHETDRVAFDMAAKTVIEPLPVIHVERRRLFVVERTRRPHIALSLIGLTAVQRHR